MYNKLSLWEYDYQNGKKNLFKWHTELLGTENPLYFRISVTLTDKNNFSI